MGDDPSLHPGPQSATPNPFDEPPPTVEFTLAIERDSFESTEHHVLHSDLSDQTAPFSSRHPADSEKTEIRGDAIVDVPAAKSTTVFLPQSGDAVHQLVGQSLDHYRIESLVGIGGMGAVFRGRDQRLDRVVAVKVVPMAHRRADAMRRFRMEAQSAAKLDHPNIARVYYVGETERWSYIVFEFIEGTNLRQLVLEHGPLTVDDATHFTCQVAEALQHAHERGVVHRDIKPSNILRGTDGRAKVVDMGLARTTELDRSTGDLTASGVTLGTFDYISPEQAHDPRDADVRSDIYSLGCTLYFLLTAQPPFPDGTALQKLLMHGTKMPEDPRFFRNDLSDPLIAILRKMMAKKPKDRYQEPADLVNDLRMLAVIDSLAWGQAIHEDTIKKSGSRRSWWEASLPSMVCLLLISMVTMWLYNSNQLNAVFPIPRVEVTEPTLAENSSDASRVADPRDSEQPAGKTTTDSGVTSKTTSTSPNSNPTSDPFTNPASNPTPTSPNTNNTPTNPQPNNTIATNKTSSTPTPEVPAKLPQRSTQVLVIDPTTPSQIPWLDQPHAIVSTWDEAMSKLAGNPGIDRIVLNTNTLSIQRPIEWSKSKDRPLLQIESAPTRRCRITLDESSLRSSTVEPNTWLSLDGAGCAFQDVDLDWNASLNDGRPQSIFGLIAGARVSLLRCTITIRHTGTGLLPSVVQIGKPGIEPSPTTPLASGFSTTQSCIRGQCDWMRIATSERAELAVKNCWTAVSGSMVIANGAKSLNRSPKIRLELDNTTCITLGPWTRIRMTMMTPYPVALVRIANQSIFSGCNTLIEWDASNCNDWSFAAQAKKIEDLGRWIDLRGVDNAYDVPSIVKLVQVLMSMSSEEVSIDSDTNLLRNERGMELHSAWQTMPRIDSAKIHLQTPKAFQWIHSGFQPGCQIDSLPIFPATIGDK
jgi:serine/threonine protein kinase